MFRQLVTCLLCFTCVSNANTSAADYRKQLISDLLTHYSNYVAPQNNTDDVVKLNITYYLWNILDLDHTGEILTSNGWMNVTWYDFRLTWNNTSYGRVDHIYMSRKAVWIPDINIDNTATQHKVVGNSEDNLKIRWDGMVRWYPGDVYRTRCNLDITYFPFDEQTCAIVIVMWSNNLDTVRINSVKAPFSVTKEHGEWEVNDIKINVGVLDCVSISNATVHVKMKRRSTFYVVNIILPVITTTFLNAFVFILPAEDGETITLATALFLSYAVFLSYITDNMPKTSTSVSILGVFVAAQLILSALSILCTVVILKLYHKKEKTSQTKEHNAANQTFGHRRDNIFFVVFFLLGLGASVVLLVMFSLT